MYGEDGKLNRVHDIDIKYFHGPDLIFCAVYYRFEKCYIDHEMFCIN